LGPKRQCKKLAARYHPRGEVVEETKIALVPRVVVTGAMGPRDYGLLLTDRRSIFVLETSPKVLVGAVLGGAFGAAVAQSVASRAAVDYHRATPDDLARRPKSIVVPHDSIVRLALRRKLGGHRLRIEYRREDGKAKTLASVVVPPAESLKVSTARGMRPKDAIAAYANRVRTAFVRALPPAAAAKAEWGP
jgi:hypothetical protein